MTARINLFSNNFSGASSSLVEFLRNQPGHGKSEGKARGNGSNYRRRRAETGHKHDDDADAYDDRGGQRINQGR